MPGMTFSLYFRRQEMPEALWFDRLPEPSRWLVRKIREEMRDEPFLLEQHILELEKEIEDAKVQLVEARKREVGRPRPVVPPELPGAITPELVQALMERVSAPEAEWDAMIYRAVKRAAAGATSHQVEAMLTGPAYVRLMRDAPPSVPPKRLAQMIVDAVAAAARPAAPPQRRGGRG